jgi:hypothetical protein
MVTPIHCWYPVQKKKKRDRATTLDGSGTENGSRENVAGIKTRYGPNVPGFEFRQGQAILSSSKPFNPALWGSNRLLTNRYRGTFRAVKRSALEFHHSTPSNVEIKNKWNYTSAPLYAFMAWKEITGSKNGAYVF